MLTLTICAIPRESLRSLLFTIADSTAWNCRVSAQTTGRPASARPSWSHCDNGPASRQIRATWKVQLGEERHQGVGFAENLLFPNDLSEQPPPVAGPDTNPNTPSSRKRKIRHSFTRLPRSCPRRPGRRPPELASPPMLPGSPYRACRSRTGWAVQLRALDVGHNGGARLPSWMVARLVQPISFQMYSASATPRPSEIVVVDRANRGARRPCN